MILRFTLCKDGSLYTVYDVANFCIYPVGVGIIYSDGTIHLIDFDFLSLRAVIFL